MRRRFKVKLIALGLLCFCMPLQAKTIAQKKIVGIAHVQDGDSLRVGNFEVRLFGVDAFELNQKCGKMACGRAAHRFMQEQVERKTVICTVRDRDKYGRYVAICKKQNGQDLGAMLVRHGLGVAYRSFSNDYIEEERAAKAEKAGAWGYGFQSPLNYRRVH